MVTHIVSQNDWSSFCVHFAAKSTTQRHSLHSLECGFCILPQYSWFVLRYVKPPITIKGRNAHSRHTNAMKCVSHWCYPLMKQHSSIRSTTSIEISGDRTDWVDRSKIQNPLDTQIQAQTLSWFLSTSSLRSKFIEFIEFVWPKVFGCLACRHSNPGRRPIFCYSDASDASIRRQHATKDASHKTFPSPLFHSSVSLSLPATILSFLISLPSKYRHLCHRALTSIFVIVRGNQPQRFYWIQNAT